MNWKRFSIVFVNLVFLCFPYNILGCADGVDPYDYFTSFFQNDLPSAKTLSPFYYTNYRFLYSDTEPVDVSEATSSEWVNYCGGKPDRRQAYRFVCEFASKDLSNLYYYLEKNQALKIPDSVKANAMTAYFFGSKDLEALGYLMYAKQAEPLLTGSWNEWEPLARDTARMAKLMKSGQQLYAAATKDFIKLRFAYELLRLAHYSGHYEDCIRWFDQLVQPNTVKSILHDLSASLYAGALYHKGRKTEAAYLFSRQFSRMEVKKVSNYMSFSFCVSRFNENEKKQCMALCKSKEEKADMLALFALGSKEMELSALKEIAATAPQAGILEMLTIREVNKIEDNYLSPALKKQPGSSKIYALSPEDNTNGNLQEWSREASSLAFFCHALSANTAVKNKGLYETAAAYLSYISRNYPEARKYISSATNMTLNQALKDQLQLTSLLVSINEKDKLDEAFEESLVSSIKWLEAKARKEKFDPSAMDNENNTWRRFYRNLLLEILAKRYHQQGDIYKEALCIGNAFLGDDYVAKEFVRNEMDTKDILALNSLLNAPKKNRWEVFLCSNFPMKNDEVTDVIAVSHTRDFNFAEAILWLSKIKDREVLKLQRNPFGSLLKDNQDSIYSFDKGTFDKLSFIKEINSLMESEKQGKATPAILFKLATGYYNITYYGRAWEVVRYNRSGADGYYIPKNATAFQKEYYGCFRAETYFKKAMEASSDPNFKAHCLFLMAKCAQKQVPQPQYQDFSNNYSAMELAQKKYIPLFKNNKYFPQFVKEYEKTTFYREAFNTCSYLKDFVRKK